MSHHQGVLPNESRVVFLNFCILSDLLNLGKSTCMANVIAGLFVDDFGNIRWESTAIIAFTVAFVIVGIMRTVEFSSIGLRPLQKKVYVTLHTIGCLLFGTAMTLGAINLYEDKRTLMFSMFIAAMVFLAPGQFKIGMVRRKVLREEFEKTQGLKK